MFPVSRKSPENIFFCICGLFPIFRRFWGCSRVWYITSAAAEFVELDDYDVKFLSTPLSPQEQFINQLIDNFGLAGVLSKSRWLSAVTRVSSSGVLDDVQRLMVLNDPKRGYAICAMCQSAPLL